MFNHESPRRGVEFVTRKITSHAAKIKLRLVNNLKLGNLEAKRDWGHAKEYVKAMWLMLQQDKPEDFVIATGECYTVNDFVRVAFQYVDIDPKDVVQLDKSFYRPAEVQLLQGDSSYAQEKLGWKYNLSFKNLVEEMVESDLEYNKSTLKYIG